MACIASQSTVRSQVSTPRCPLKRGSPRSRSQYPAQGARPMTFPQAFQSPNMDEETRLICRQPRHAQRADKSQSVDSAFWRSLAASRRTCRRPRGSPCRGIQNCRDATAISPLASASKRAPGPHPGQCKRTPPRAKSGTGLQLRRGTCASPRRPADSTRCLPGRVCTRNQWSPAGVKCELAPRWDAMEYEARPTAGQSVGSVHSVEGGSEDSPG